MPVNHRFMECFTSHWWNNEGMLVDCFKNVLYSLHLSILSKSNFEKTEQLILILIRRQNTINSTHADRCNIATTLGAPNTKDKKKSWGTEQAREYLITVLLLTVKPNRRLLVFSPHLGKNAESVGCLLVGVRYVST